jgi:hypothetical protein
MTCTGDTLSFQEVTSGAKTNSSWLIGRLYQSPSRLNRIYSLLFVRTNENHVSLTNVFLHMHDIIPRTYSHRLDLSRPDYGDRNCLVLTFRSSSRTKELLAPRQMNILSAQTKQCNISALPVYILLTVPVKRESI